MKDWNPIDRERLHQRILKHLGWPESRSLDDFSFMFLREVVKSEKLKNDITEFIRTGYLTTD